MRSDPGSAIRSGRSDNCPTYGWGHISCANSRTMKGWPVDGGLIGRTVNTGTGITSIPVGAATVAVYTDLSLRLNDQHKWGRRDVVSGLLNRLGVCVPCILTNLFLLRGGYLLFEGRLDLIFGAEADESPAWKRASDACVPAVVTRVPRAGFANVFPDHCSATNRVSRLLRRRMPG